MKSNYRPEIDGLRALAIIFVIIYHSEINLFGIKIFSGGYLGVDIFFVISGYIISKVIINEYKLNTFSIKFFFYRRARRIFPVLLIVSIFTILMGWKILVPTAFIQLSESIFSSLIFISNFYFSYSDQIYGNDNGLIKPFLHTWSLSIEEQFYIFFPIVLIFSLKNNNNKILFLIFIISFISTFSFLYAPKENFYFIYSRLWELLFGALVCLYETKINNSKYFLKNLSKLKIFSLIGIIICVSIFDNSIPHPSYLTLLPVILISILLFRNENPSVVDHILSIKFLVFIGLISYSLYLWHYPIFAYTRISEVAKGSLSIKFLIVLCLFLLSSITFYFVEKPIRKINYISKPIIFLIFFLFSIILFLCLNIITNDGYKTRFKNLSEFYSYEYDNEILQKESHKYLNNTKLYKNDSETNVLVIGDSHSIGIYNAFHLNRDIFKEYNFAWRRAEFFPFAIKKKYLKNKDTVKKIKYTNQTLLSDTFNNADIVVLSYRFSDKGTEGLNEFLKFLKQKNKKIILMSQTNEYKTYGGIYSTEYDQLIRNAIKNKLIINKETISKLKRKLYLEKNDFKSLNKKLKQISESHKIKFYSKQDYLCNESAEECYFLTNDKKKIFFDYGHLTLSGSEFVGEYFKKSEILNLNK